MGCILPQPAARGKERRVGACIVSPISAAKRRPMACQAQRRSTRRRALARQYVRNNLSARPGDDGGKVAGQVAAGHERIFQPVFYH